MELSPDVTARYTQIIDSILAASDLNTISEKRIRRGLQDAINQDLTPQKAVIKELIMERFDIFAMRQETAAAAAANGASTHSESPAQSSSSPQPPQKRSADEEDDVANSIETTQTPPAKKQKQKQERESDTTNSDAMLAARLQAEENQRARPTRGAATRKAAPAKRKKTTKSKGAKKITADDDSDLESSVEPKEVNRTGGFHKPLNLSEPLAALLGETTLSRPQTVKKVWEYIRKHDLQDPADKRHILCDDLMRGVFKQDRIHMFTMTKILSQNLYNPDE